MYVCVLWRGEQYSQSCLSPLLPLIKWSATFLTFTMPVLIFSFVLLYSHILFYIFFLILWVFWAQIPLDILKSLYYLPAGVNLTLLQGIWTGW